MIPPRIRQLVQTRAHFMCEYRKLPDHLAFTAFEIDHIIAKSHGGGWGGEPGMVMLHVQLQ